MSTSRPFTYNTGSLIDGTLQIGDLAIGTPTNGFASTGLQWWNGPDEDLGYVIGYPNYNCDQPTPIPPTTACVQFWRSGLNESSFINLSNNFITGTTANSGNESKRLLNLQGYWTSWVYQNVIIPPTYYNVASLDWPIYTKYNTSVYVNNSTNTQLSLVNSGYTLTSVQNGFTGEPQQTSQDSTGRYIYYGGTNLKKYDVDLNTVSTAAAPGGGSTNLWVDYDQTNNYLYVGGYNQSSSDSRMYRYNSNLGLLNSWVLSYSGIGSVYGVHYNPNDGLVYYSWGNDDLWAFNPTNGLSSHKVKFNSRNFGRTIIVPETNEMYYRGSLFISGSTYKTSICVVNLDDLTQTEYDIQFATTDINSSSQAIVYDTQHNLVWYKQPGIGFKGIDIYGKEVYVTASTTKVGGVSATVNYNTNELVTCYALVSNKGFEIYDLSSL